MSKGYGYNPTNNADMSFGPFYPSRRELWHRASLVWQHLLRPGELEMPAEASAGPTAAKSVDPRVILVVAHNAINQALVGTALGLPPSYFRCSCGFTLSFSTRLMASIR
jgi:hypothetical protein